MQRSGIRLLLVVLVIGMLFALYGNEAPANHAGTATLSASNTFGTAVLDVDFLVTADPPSDAGCLAHSWTLDFGDGASQTGGNAGTFIVSHQYSNFSLTSQIYIAQLSFSRQGQHEPRGPRCETAISLAQVVITINSPIPLIAVILEYEPIVGPPPVDVGFDGSQSQTDPNCPISNQIWSFGDGMSAEGAMVAHTYMDVGLFEVMLSAEDRCGRRDARTSKVFVRRLVPEGFDEIAMAVEEIGMAVQSTKVMLAEAQSLADEKLPMALAELGQGSAVGTLGNLAQQLLMGLCDQGALTDTFAIDQLVSLLEQAISKMGVEPSPWSEVKPLVEGALMKLQDAKAMLPSDPAGAFMVACGSDGALMKLGDGMNVLLPYIMETLMTLQDQCVMLQMDVADLLMPVRDWTMGQQLTEIYDLNIEGFDGSALKEAIRQALLLMPTGVLEDAAMTLQELCHDLEHFIQAPEMLFEGLYSMDHRAPEAVRDLERLLDKIKDSIQEASGGPIYGDRPEDEFSTEVELFFEAITPLNDALVAFTCLGHFVTAGMVGTDASDYITATANADVINARGGDDYVFGLDGSDIICGGAGNDWIEDQGGDDTVDGGPGNDVLIFGWGGNDLLIGGTGDDSLVGGQGDDTIYGEEGADQLYGSGGQDYLHGGSGDDDVRGSFDDDNVNGGEGNDALSGSAGYDECDGGPGDDTLRDVNLDLITGQIIPGSHGCEIIYSIP